MTMRSWQTLVLSLLVAGGAAHAADVGHTREVLVAVEALRDQLSATERAALERPFERGTAIHWSNLPTGIVPRSGLRLGDLDAPKGAAARRLLEATLSAAGMTLLDEIRLADDVLLPMDQRKIGWNSRNYYLTILGTPSARQPWMLQVGGHHIAYNFTFNGRQSGATPMFFGTEPIRFNIGGVDHEPLLAQSTAMAKLAAALAAHPEAKLSGTFTDVVKGVEFSFVDGKPVGGTDTGYPHSYPTGGSDRGIRYSVLTTEKQLLVRQALQSYTRLPGEGISRALVADYQSPAALADTWVGFAGTPDLSAKGSYVRIDGPRIWMEFVVQPAVADPSTMHYHALWRDKLADYGGEVGKQ